MATHGKLYMVFFFLKMCLKLKCRFSQKYICKNELCVIQNRNLFKMEAK
jgi:hypothetical protein